MTRTSHGKEDKFYLRKIVEPHLGKIKNQFVPKPSKRNRRDHLSSQSEIYGHYNFFL